MQILWDNRQLGELGYSNDIGDLQRDHLTGEVVLALEPFLNIEEAAPQRGRCLLVHPEIPTLCN